MREALKEFKEALAKGDFLSWEDIRWEADLLGLYTLERDYPRALEVVGKTGRVLAQVDLFGEVTYLAPLEEWEVEVAQTLDD